MADGFDLAIRFGEPELSSLIGRKVLESQVLTCAAPSYLKRSGCRNIPGISPVTSVFSTASP